MSEQMKLSEAIRKGAKLRPQARGFYFVEGAFKNCGSCALGAAHEAVFGNTDTDRPGCSLWEVYPDLLSSAPVKMPNGVEVNLFTAVKKLNDGFEWTREQIADWLEEKGY